MTKLTGELFKLQAGRLEMTHVPYKGGGPAMQDLMAGHIPVITPILHQGGGRPLRNATVKMRCDAGFVQDIERAGAELFSQTDEEKVVRDEAARWTKVIRDIGFKLK